MTDQSRDIFGNISDIGMPTPQEKPNPIVEEKFSAWVSRVEASSFDQETKGKLLVILGDAKKIFGESNRGSEDDRIGERLSTTAFTYGVHHPAERESIKAFVQALIMDMTKAHRALVSEKRAKYSPDNDTTSRGI
ncbi:hypothetical protein HY625_02620 [Candidatus Uhrbacteria bacterium]|nr:hypothetical protein [Candidatus Uhrbacteria bacterium]